MRTTALRLLSIFNVMLLVSFMTAISSIKAGEDPAERKVRQMHNHLARLRQRYRAQYPYAHLPEARLYKILSKYPKKVIKIARGLPDHGTPQPTSDEKILAHLRALDAAYERLLVTVFHPKVVEEQPAFIRIQHLHTSNQLSDWMHDHYEDLKDLVGEDQAAQYRERYKNFRNLAGFAVMLPGG